MWCSSYSRPVLQIDASSWIVPGFSYPRTSSYHGSPSIIATWPNMMYVYIDTDIDIDVDRHMDFQIQRLHDMDMETDIDMVYK